VVRGDRLYDSKAILGYANGVATGTQWRPEEFSNGEATVATTLRALGHEVRNLANPNWARDEVILACDLVADNDWRQLDTSDERVMALSALLQTSVIFRPDQRGPDFRNPAGVARKTADIATRHPNYTGTPTNGGRLDREVLADFMARPDEMRLCAAAIRDALQRGELPPLTRSDVDVDAVAAEEGGVLLRQHLHRERDARLRSQKLAAVLRVGGVIACEVCGFDFERAYGERGRGYIECHHRTPLFSSGSTKTRLRDLALICSNCHRMIHRTKSWLLPEQLKQIVDERR
jgi:5-methylcytosine-specific restriction enzyme A